MCAVGEKPLVLVYLLRSVLPAGHEGPIQVHSACFCCPSLLFFLPRPVKTGTHVRDARLLD